MILILYFMCVFLAGTIDMDMITTGQTALGRETTHQLTSEVHNYLRQEYAAGRRNTTINQIYQGIKHNMNNNNSHGGGLGEGELSVEKVNAAVEALAREKVIQMMQRTGTVNVLPAITEEF